MTAKTTGRALLLGLALSALLACGRAGEETRSGPDKIQALSLTIPNQRAGLSFRYFDPGSGRFATALTRDLVPEAARHLVMVYDETLPQGAVKPGEMILADLREANDEGLYPYRVVNQAKSSRRVSPPPAAPSGNEGEHGARPAAQAGAKARSTNGLGERVILFVTSWCPHCRTAEAWFTKQGVSFLKMDVERKPGARELLMKLFRDNKVPEEYANSVPIIAIDGKILLGFDPKEIQKQL